MSLLEEWAGNTPDQPWFCYWTGSFGLPADPQTDFVFKPSLEMIAVNISDRDQCQRVIKGPLANAPLEETNSACARLCALYQKMDDITCDCMGSESEYPYYPIMLSLDANVNFSASSILTALGAHPQLLDSIILPKEVDEESLFGSLSKEIYDFLSGVGTQKPLVFYCGSDRLNPVPLFAVGLVTPSVIAGFISGIVHT